MSFWGKLLGGMAGFALGGPFGAVVGAAMGHAADNGPTGRLDLSSLLGAGLPPPRLMGAIGGRDQVFAVAVTVLSAKLAKVDGPVNRSEIDAFKRHFRVPPEGMGQIARLFDMARDTAEGFEAYATELGHVFADDRPTLESVLAALFAIARADRPLSGREYEMLRQIHHAFGLDNLAWDQARGASAFTRPEPGAPSPYQELGVAREAATETVRAAWLRQVRASHPDRLAAEGADAARLAAAGERVARLNAAWDRIKRERGL